MRLILRVTALPMLLVLAIAGCVSTPEEPVVEPDTEALERVESLEDRVAEMETELESRQAQIADLETQLAATVEQLALSNEQLELAQRELGTALEHAGELGDALDAQMRQAARLAQDNARLEEIIEDLRLVQYLFEQSGLTATDPPETPPAAAETAPAESVLDRPAVAVAPVPDVPDQPQIPPVIEEPTELPPQPEPVAEPDPAPEPAPTEPAMQTAPPVRDDGSYRQISQIGPVQETTRRSAVALSQLITDRSTGVDRLYDSRIDYTASATYLTAELSSPPRLLLIAQLVRSGRPQFVSAATLVVTDGQGEQRVDLGGNVERETTGTLLREAIVIEVAQETLPAIAAIAAVEQARVEFRGISETFVHELTRTEQAAIANLLVSYLDLGGGFR